MADRCYLCKKVVPGRKKSKEHVIPKAIWRDAVSVDYNMYLASNVLPSCRQCNEMKDSKILMLPITTYSWWPLEYIHQLEDLQIVFRCLLERIMADSDRLKLKSDYFQQWIDDYGSFRREGVSNSIFNREKIFVDTTEYMTSAESREAWEKWRIRYEN